MINYFTKEQITRSFNRAATSYNQANFLQKEVGEKLFSQLNFFAVPSNILDLGCGTGILTARLANTFPKSQVMGVDISHNMIMYAEPCFKEYTNLSFLCADADKLPFPDESCDLIFSNLMLQWSPNIAVTLCEWSRLLKQGGKVFFSTFGRGSLQELHSVWSQVDNFTHVSNFISLQKLLTNMEKVGFKNLKFETCGYKRSFDSVYELMMELKMLGAHNLRVDRNKGLLGKNKFKKLLMAYDEYRDINNKLPLTFEVCCVSSKK